MNDTELLATYWATEFIEQATDEDGLHNMPPIVVSCGCTADAVIANQAEGDEQETTAHLIGVFTYPTDAIHIVTVAMSLAVNVDDDDSPLVDPSTDPRCRYSVTAWAHEIPTSETTVVCMIRQVTPAGAQWRRIMASEGVAHSKVFDGFKQAAHDFDQFPIEDNEAAMRFEAMEEIEAANGGAYEVNFYSPGTVMGVARNHFPTFD
jgi:hypothetical protein